MQDEYSQLPPDEQPAAPPRRPAAPPPESGVDVPWDQLNPDTLSGLIEAFILREGTDYGSQEASLARKINEVRRQLESGDAKVVYDQSTESCSIVTT